MQNRPDDDKKAVISDVIRNVGWTYYSMKWPSASEARRANALYQKAAARIADSGRVSFSGSKLHLGPLSKGCLICGGGRWSCMYFTLKCSSNCFFCPQSPTHSNPPPLACGIAFKRPIDYVDFLDKFGYYGASFSGGDPLILTDKLAKYIKAIKKQFGNKMYVWAYTSGKPVNKHRLALLQRAGLDELRIDIAANDYNLDPVLLAKKYIKTVTVEIPTIPEDEKILLKTLHSMDKAAVDHLNIHELVASPHNVEAFRDRGYTFVHYEHVFVLESTLMAIRCLEYALDHDIRTPINFCTRHYQLRFQSAGYRHRFSPIVKKKHETITKSGFIRKLFICDNHECIARLAEYFDNIPIKRSQWSWNKHYDTIDFNPSIIETLGLRMNRNIFYVQYTEPYTSNSDAQDSRLVELDYGKRFYIGRNTHDAIGPLSTLDLKLFKALFIDQMNLSEIRELKYFNELASVELEEFKTHFKRYEEIGGGFAEIF